MAETINDILHRHADDQAHAIAVTLLRDGTEIAEQISYEALDRRARAIAATLQAKNLQGNRALVLYPSGIEFLSAFFGCLYSGVIAVPAPPPDPSRLKRALPRLEGIIRDCDASVVLTENSIASLSMEELESAKSNLEWIGTDAITDDACSGWKPIQVNPGALAYLQYTSGSTSTPKGIEISHFNLFYHLGYLKNTCSYDRNSVTITWMPNYHDWGLVEGILESIYVGAPVYLMSPISFVRRPIHWLEAISRFGGTHSQGPTFAYDHCWRRIPDDEIGGLDLRSWSAAGIAAEPINYSVMKGFYEKFRRCGFRWTTFSPAFGLGEATLKMTCCGEGEAPSALILDAEELEGNKAVLSNEKSSNVRTVVSCGSAYGETEIAIAEPETYRRLEEGRVGEIWIRDPAVARGYWNLTEESERTFRARLSDGHGPFMRTGDLGFLRDKKLYVTGRLKDLIIIRGSNHYPQDIEWTAQSAHEDLAGQTSAAFSVEHDGSERLVLFQEIRQADANDEDLAQIMSAVVAKVADAHELDVFDLVIVKRGTIPKTASGKVQRQLSRRAYLDNKYTSLARWQSRLNLDGAVRIAVGENRRAAKRSNQTAIRVSEAASSIGHQEINDWLRDYASKRINSFLIDQRRCVPPHIILDFGNQGLFGLQVPKEYGGLGLSFQSSLAVLQQLAAIDISLATLIFLSNTNGLRPILNFGNDQLKAKLLPELASGRKIAAFALSEPVAGSNIGAIQTKAVRLGNESWQISGEKRWNGSAWADVITVIAREFDSTGKNCGVSAFLLRQRAKGLHVGEESLTAGLRGIVQNSLQLCQVEVGKDSLLGASGEGWIIVNDALNIGRLCTAAVCLGGMKRAAQLLLRYARVRKIATGNLIDHPNTQFQLAEITCKIETIEAVVNYLAIRLDGNENVNLLKKVTPLLMMAVKVGATEYFNQTSACAVQLLGGRGYMENNEAPRLFRDARSLSIGEGPNEGLVAFLGRSANTELIRSWLASIDVNTSKDFADVCDKIRDCCEQRKEISTGQRGLWSEYLCGLVATQSTMSAIIASPGLPKIHNRFVQQWCELQLDRVVRESIQNASQCAASRPISAVEASIDGFGYDIGDIVQAMPTEDHKLDPLLSGDVFGPRQAEHACVENTSAPNNDGGNAQEKKRRLEELLRLRVSLKEND